MAKIILINTRPTRPDTRLELDQRLEAYFASLANRGPKFGDTRTEPNNGLLILGHLLRASGHQVDYLDMSAHEFRRFEREGKFYTFDEMTAIVETRASDADFIFLSAIVVGIDDCLALANLLKEKYPDKIVVLGGTFPSLEPEYCLKHGGGVDALIVGEGEEVVPVLVEAFLKGDFRALQNMKGIYFREERPRPHIRCPGFNTVDLAALGRLGMPDWSLLDSGLGDHVYRVMTARGCGFSCSFCVPSRMSGHCVRAFDPSVVLDSIKQVKEKFGARNYVIGDLTFFYDQEASREILKRIKQENIGLPFWCQTHLTRVTPRNLEFLAQAGCRQVAVGVESINPSILENVNKCINPAEIVNKLLLIKEYGIEPQCYFIVGLPGDSLETIALNREFIKYGVSAGFIDRTHLGIFVPYPGLTPDPRVHTQPMDYRHFTQGVFRDIPAQPVYTMEGMDQDDLYEAYADSLGQVGQALQQTPIKDLRNLSPRKRRSLILGAELVQLRHNLQRQAEVAEAVSVLNLVQGMRDRGRSFVSPHPQQTGGFVVGNLELYDDVDAGLLVELMDGQVDAILLDADIKNKHSARLRDQVVAAAQRSKVLFYSDQQSWARTVANLIMNICPPDRSPRRVCLAPDNELSHLAQGLLINVGFEVSLKPNLTNQVPLNQPYHVLVSFALHQEDRAGMGVFDLLTQDGVLVDGGIGSFEEQVYQTAHRKDLPIYRPDMRITIAADIFLGLELGKFLDQAVGRRVIDDLTFVSGGVVGQPGSLVVDSVKTPRRLLGLADGKGAFLSWDKINDSDLAALMKARAIVGKKAAAN